MIYLFLTNLSRRYKLVLWWTVDTLLVPVCVYLAFALRLDTLTPFVTEEDLVTLAFLLTAAGAAFVYFYRLPLVRLRDFDLTATTRTGVCAISLALAAISFSYFFKLHAPRSVPIIAGGLFFLLSIMARISGTLILSQLKSLQSTTIAVAIYGAGSAGIQLAAALRNSKEIEPVLFVDDNPSLQGVMVSGLMVANPNRLGDLIQSRKIDRVILAMPSIQLRQQKSILSDLSKLACEVRVIPSFVDIISSNSGGDGARAVKPDDLLGRDKVDFDNPHITKTYSGRIVMVTGAGGSIGSELCRQIVCCNPAGIVLFDHSEYALYEIEHELKVAVKSKDVLLITRLGSVTDGSRVASVIEEAKVDILVHAAAYKHVPLIEDNEFEGVRNNVFGTSIVANAAEAAGIERFILISTDKAVRPTNIMGASKRMAELVIQDLASRSCKTKFSMVRFGNVLGSSGSVVPLFQSQIMAGGPVTVTHPDVTRFFMTIPEAARLVLLAGSYAQGGDVFVLNMGEPKKIIDVARQLIELSGKRVKGPGSNGAGIEIKIVGLRPGEKLFEELLINDKKVKSTPHGKILRAQEVKLSQIEVASMLQELQINIENNNHEALRSIVFKWVEGVPEPLSVVPN